MPIAGPGGGRDIAKELCVIIPKQPQTTPAVATHYMNSTAFIVRFGGGTFTTATGQPAGNRDRSCRVVD